MNGIDVDNDTLTYEINITRQGGLGTCSDSPRIVDSLTQEEYTVDPLLNCFYDNLDYYSWKVRATDNFGYGEWSNSRIINISALVDISLPVNEVNFNSINPLQSNDTSDDSPAPFVIQNDGNALVNISAKASDLWTSSSNPNNYYKFKADNKTGESGAFNWLLSAIDWIQMPNITGAVIGIAELNWSDSKDSAEVDVYIDTPQDEAPSQRNSTVTFESSLAE